ncbi:MAG: hypothetical protein KAV41_01845 [Candidatus Pacebacteria bacterium]|nr:hypothetical protein [Candidatus Paceibacterota bacterium]
MSLTTIEVLATITIVIGIIKVLAILTAPRGFKNFARKIYGKPAVLKTVSFVLAAIVLYCLVNAGITIAEIFAISLFVSLLIAVVLADYGEVLIQQIDYENILEKQWLYTLLWFALIIWGIYEIFFV